MSKLELLIVVLVTIGTAVAAVLITVAVSSVVEAHRVRLEPLLADARLAIVAALSGGDMKAEMALTHLSPFSEHLVVDMMLDLAPSVTGTSKTALVSLGEQIGILERARTGIHARRWSTRLYSARVLTAFSVESEDVHLLFSDRSPDVRAQAAAWCVSVPSDRGTVQLIALLEDDDGHCRFAAKDALIRIGRPATEALVSAMGGTDVSVTNQILEIAAASGDERFFGPAADLVRDASPTSRALALAVVASTGSSGAAPLLVAGLDDGDERVMVAAAAGIARLAYWPGATAVEPLLSHPSWDVRRQAAMTLLALDAPGTILLRADAPGVGPAAEMAIQALELQALSTQEETA
jgi:hypothetical protein